MFKLFPYILKTLWRHRARSMLTLIGAAAAIFVFCFVESVQQGMRDLQQRRESEGSLIVFQAHKFCPATSHLPQDYERRIGELEGVREVIPIQVLTNNCRASLDVVVFYGMPPRQLRRARNFTLLSGDWAEFEQHQDAAIVGRAVAQRRGIETGGKFSLGELTVTVAGIFSSPDPSEENHIYSHLEFLQRGKGSHSVGTVTQIEVLLEPDVEATAKCEEIDTLFRSGPVETNTRPKGAFQAASLGDLSHLVELARYLGWACIALVFALVATTTAMSVQDRIAEHAVLQTLGFSGIKVFRLVLTESVLLSCAGGAIGIGLATLVLATSNLAVGAEAVTVAFTPSLRLAMHATMVALVAGLAAGLGPAVQAARIEIVAALRQ
jgi:putative ABC transport system permease protein